MAKRHSICERSQQFGSDTVRAVYRYYGAGEGREIEISVNGRSVQRTIFSFSDLSRFRSIDLSDFVQAPDDL